ncbi:MAG TPA: hypothetical protein VND68_13930, partial [Chloroflexia bacterium]|nr:hypothetical protein [Chloroflexia bacterium]
MGLATDLLVWTGKNLASGAVGDIGGLAVGGLLSAIGMGQDDGVAALGAQLDQVQSTLAQIQDELNKLQEDIDTQLKAIQQELLYDSWSQRDIPMQRDITHTLTQYTTYLEYINTPHTTTPQQVDDLVRLIK